MGVSFINTTAILYMFPPRIVPNSGLRRRKIVTPPSADLAGTSCHWAYNCMCSLYTGTQRQRHKQNNTPRTRTGNQKSKFCPSELSAQPLEFSAGYTPHQTYFVLPLIAFVQLSLWQSLLLAWMDDRDGFVNICKTRLLYKVKIKICSSAHCLPLSHPLRHVTPRKLSRRKYGPWHKKRFSIPALDCTGLPQCQYQAILPQTAVKSATSAYCLTVKWDLKGERKSIQDSRHNLHLFIQLVPRVDCKKLKLQQNRFRTKASPHCIVKDQYKSKSSIQCGGTEPQS